MTTPASNHSHILRVFRVKARPDCAEQLCRNFATTSADVVQNEPGNLGYYFGQGVEDDADSLVFASLWENLDVIKTRFGANWKQSYLPDGYVDLIEDYSLEHIRVGAGWHIPKP